MTIEVLLFAAARDWIGRSRVTISLPSGARVREILKVPELSALVGRCESLRWAINEEFVTLDTLINHGDAVAVLPPISGG